ncbi:hypothetical protein EZV62_026625 [Acer yangbiense]|uniref:F-box domain-containing protein n=1 Tax=Acer yangbiense TaxID=1000413 RepID=A0A5C7GR97_9ROSI|nr:hypothetical protein EZV62_026625 [Acer yangbiense]
MGSLPSPSWSLTPPESNLSSHHLVYASFCHREPEPTKSRNISNWIECYSPCNNTWSHVSSIPDLIDNQVLKGFSMVSIGDSIYIIGGRLCHKRRASEDEDDHQFVDIDVDVLSQVLCYNVESNQWTKCASMVAPRYDFACTILDNKIYVAGGKSNLSSCRGISSAEVYNPQIDEWTALPNMTALRYKCVGVTWQGKIHVVGGFAERAESDGRVERVQFTERSSAEVYNTLAGKWDLVARMWQLDIPPNQIVALDNRLFSSGDCLKAWKGHIEAYDGELNIWNEVDGSHLQTLNSPISRSSITNDHDHDDGDYCPPVQRLYLTMAPIGTHLYFLVGHRTAGELSRTMSMVHMFDTRATSDAWRSFEPMIEDGEKELCSHCCVVQQLS